jgi:hypothetical protein
MGCAEKRMESQVQIEGKLDQALSQRDEKGSKNCDSAWCKIKVSLLKTWLAVPLPPHTLTPTRGTDACSYQIFTEISKVLSASKDEKF